MRRQRPPRVYDVGDEPDPRFSLANERTFLAWTRTSLAMLAGSVALHSLQVPEPDLLRTALVVALALFAGVATALSYVRWAKVERAMRTRTPLPPFSLGLTVTLAISGMSVVLAVALALS